MKILGSLKNLILPRKGAVATPVTAKRNNVSLIIDELMFVFNESISSMSTDRNLIFHTAYVVYVPRQYFRDLNLSFGIISKEVSQRFTEEIQKRMARNKAMACTPISNVWSFDIIGLREEGSDTPDDENPDSRVTYEDLEENFVAVRSSLVPAELYNFSAVDEDATIQTNRSQPSSTYNRAQRLSVSAIVGLKPSGNGYTYPIELETNTETELAGQPGVATPGQQRGGASSTTPVGAVTGTLACLDNELNFTDSKGNKFQSLDMRVDHFFVGGPTAADSYHGCPMVRLDAEEVQSPHFEVRRDKDGTFFLNAIGPVTVCQIPAAPGQWVRIPDTKATICLNAEYRLEFNKQK